MYYTAAAHKEHVDSVALDIEQFVKELAEAALLNGFILVRIHFFISPLWSVFLLICSIIPHILGYFKNNIKFGRNLF